MRAPTVACCCPSMPRKWPACWFTRKQAINRAGTRATSKGPKLRTAGGMTAARDRPQSGYRKKSKQVENGEVCFELARGEKETKFHPFSWQPFGFQRAIDVVHVYRRETAAQIVDNLYSCGSRLLAQPFPGR